MPPEPPPRSSFLDDNTEGGDTESQLIAAFKGGRITEAQLREELAKRNKTPPIIEQIIADNTPEPAQITPPALAGGAGIASLSDLSTADIIDLIGKTDPRDPNRMFTSEDAHQTLITDKGMTPAAANAAFQLTRGEGARRELAASDLFNAWEEGQLDATTLYKRLLNLDYSPEDARLLIDTKKAQGPLSPEFRALQDTLTSRGLGKSVNPAVAMRGAELGMWSPDEVYQSLVVNNGMTEQEAEKLLKLRGWQGQAAMPIPSRHLDATVGQIIPPNVGSAGIAPSAISGGAEQWRETVSKYFKPEDVDKALYVMQGESGGDPKAAGDGGHSLGLFQMNTAGGLGTGISPDILLDPETNIRMAADAVYGGSGWSPWGEGATYEGKPFGVLGARPYSPNTAPPAMLNAGVQPPQMQGAY